MLRDRLVELLENSLQNAVDDKKIEDVDLPSIKIEYPKDEQLGDYATPFALESARILRKSPIDIGNILKEYISRSPLVERVDVVKPGFINIFISLDFLHENLCALLKDDEGYSKNTQKSPKRINLEFVSANPTGPLNIVSARAAALGDSLANLLAADGHSVHREFYVNDYGTQVYLLGKSVLCRYRELLGETVEFPEDGYRGEYVKEIARYVRDTSADVIAQMDDEEELIHFMSEQAVKYNVQEQKNDL